MPQYSLVTFDQIVHCRIIVLSSSLGNGESAAYKAYHLVMRSKLQLCYFPSFQRAPANKFQNRSRMRLVVFVTVEPIHEMWGWKVPTCQRMPTKTTVNTMKSLWNGCFSVCSCIIGKESSLISTLRLENLANVSPRWRLKHSVETLARFSGLKVGIRELFFC